MCAEAAKSTSSESARPFAGGYASFVRGSLVLLGADEFLTNFPAPSLGDAATAKNEQRRRALCAALDWEYMPLNVVPPPLNATPLPPW
jgi:hypothetical protein